MKGLMLSKIQGSIFAAAIGDALGGPLETKTIQEIVERFGTDKVTELMHYEKPRPQGGNVATQKGTYTDDTRLRNHLCQAIIEKGGRISAQDFADLLIRDMDPQLFWPGELLVYSKMVIQKKKEELKHIKNLSSLQMLGSISARELGKSNIPACDIAMCITPVGLLSPGNPELAAKDAYDVGSVIQSGYSLNGGVCLACATSESMNPGATLEDVVGTALRFADEPNRVAIQKALDVAKKARSVSEFRKWFHENMLVGFVDVLEVVPATLGIVYIAGKNLNDALIEAANFGRDCDSIATSVGAVLGALHGIEKVPEDWMNTVKKANPEPDLDKISEGIFAALQNEIKTMEDYVSKIRKYL